MATSQGGSKVVTKLTVESNAKDMFASEGGEMGFSLRRWILRLLPSSSARVHHLILYQFLSLLIVQSCSELIYVLAPQLKQLALVFSLDLGWCRHIGPDLI